MKGSTLQLYYTQFNKKGGKYNAVQEKKNTNSINNSVSV